MRRNALMLGAMGDPRFSFKRAFTIPRKVRQAIMGTAYGALGGIPFVGGAIQGAIAQHPGAFPNIPQIQGPAGSGGAGAALALAPAATMPVMNAPGYSGPKGYGVASHVVYGNKRRRMNWANPRALGRAERRMGSFVKHFTKHARHLGIHVSRGPRGRAHIPRTRRK